MDVTCTRCSTVYEFEEGLVSASGTTVKCTQCGHLFKVHKPAAELGESAGAAPESAKWRLRRPDGSVQALESLAQLSRAIVEGKFDENDEISGTGQVWRRLGEISELSALFGPQRARPHSLRPVAAPVGANRNDDASREPGPLPPPPSSSLRPRKNTPPRDREFQVMGAPVSVDGMPSSGSLPPPAPRPPRPRTSTPAPAAPIVSVAPAAQATAAQATPAPAALLPVAPVVAAPSASASVHVAPAAALAPAPGARRFPWLIAAAVVVLAAGGAATWLTVARVAPSSQPHPARELLLRADDALASHRESRFEEAIDAYTKALAYHEDDAHILSSLSRVYAVWSQRTHSQALALRAQTTNPEPAAQLEAEAVRLAERAKHHGERAAQRNPGNSEAEVALADALRLTGNLVAARAELDRARKAVPAASAETLRVAALLTIDEAGGDYRAGRTLAEQAVSADPRMIRARALLTACLIADRDEAAARTQLDALRSLVPDHPLLDELSRELERDDRPAAADAGARVAGGTAGATGNAQRADGAAAGGASAATQSEVVEAVDDDSQAHELVRRGERALEDGAVRAAAQLFSEALELSPKDPAALTGLGYVALERGQPMIALQRFRPAARAGHPEAWIGLGDTYRRLGKVANALDAYRSYVRRFPRGPRSSIASRQIELLVEQLAATRGP